MCKRPRAAASRVPSLRHWRVILGISIALAALGSFSPAQAQWQEAGPFTSTNTLVEPHSNTLVSGMQAQGDPVYGAINTILQSPTNPNVYWAGTASGGIWKTTNGGQTWTPTSDFQASLSIGAIAFDASDPSGTTLYAGSGQYSNFGTRDGAITGLLKSTDGGNTWRALANNGLASYQLTSTGRQTIVSSLPTPSIKNIIASGSTILVAASRGYCCGATDSSGGLFRSTDGGQTFTLVPGFGTATTDLQTMGGSLIAARVSKEDPLVDAVLVSSDGGQSWHSILDSSSTIANGGQTFGSGNPLVNMHVAPGVGGSLFVGVADTTKDITRLYYTPNATAASPTWYDLGQPLLNIPGGPHGLTLEGNKQAPINFALIADPNHPGVAYIAGSGVVGLRSFPGEVATISRVNVDSSFNATYTAIVSISPANMPHSDLRNLYFNSSGQLFATSDGGVYVDAASPLGNSPSWTAFGGTAAGGSPIRAIEAYAAVIDSKGGRLAVATQDNGAGISPLNPKMGGAWANVLAGDGFSVAVNDKRNGPSIFYATNDSNQIARVTADTNLSTSNPPRLLTVTVAGMTLDNYEGQNSDIAVAVNAVDPTKILIRSGGLYTWTDPGNIASSATSINVTDITTYNVNNPADLTIFATGARNDQLAYGAQDAPDAILAGGPLNTGDPLHNGGYALLLRTQAQTDAGTPMSVANNLVTDYPGGNPFAVLFDPRTENRFFVTDPNNLYVTQNQGTSFTTLSTGNGLPSDFLNPRGLAYILNNGVDALLVGGTRSSTNGASPIIATLNSFAGSNITWQPLGSGIPNAVVQGLYYSPDIDTLVAATLGRGTWLLYDVTSNFSTAAELWFGKANNDSMPDPSLLTGNRPLHKFGAGTLRLTGTATYTGGTIIDAGVVAISTDANLGAAGAPITFNGGALRTTADLSSPRPITLDAGAIIDTLGSTTLSGAISGPGALMKTDAGTLTLSGSNTYSGGTVLAGGTLSISADGNLGTGPLDLLAGTTLHFDAGFPFTHPTTVAGDPTFDTASGTAVTIASAITDGATQGDLVKSGAGTLILAGADSYSGPTTVGAGTLAVTGSTASSPVTVQSGATLGGSGIVGAVTALGGATIAPGVLAPFTTLLANGTVTFEPGSTFRVNVGPDGRSDALLSFGSARLLGGTVQVLAGAGTYLPSARYTLLSALGGISGTFAQLATSPNLGEALAFLSPSLSYDANDVYLGFAQTIPFPSVALTRNQVATAAALQAQPAGNALYNAVIGQSVTGARLAFDALSGEVHASAVTAGFEDSRLPRDAILDRLSHPLDTPLLGVASTMTGAYMADVPGRKPELAPVEARMYRQSLFGLWGQAFGDWGLTDGDRNAAKLSRDTGGFVIGADAGRELWGSAFRFGIAGGYTDDSLKVSARTSSGDYQSIFGGLYGSAIHGPMEVKAGALIASTDTDTQRSITFPSFADQAGAHYGGTAAQAFAEAGYRLPFHGSLLSYLPGLSGVEAAYEPFLQGTLIRLDQNSFAETALAAALVGTAKTYEIGTTTLGLRTEYALATLPDLTLRTLIGWRHAFGAVKPTITESFAASFAAFSVSGVPIDRDALVSQASLDYAITPAVTLGLSYASQIGRRASDNAFKGTAEVRF